MSVQVQSAGTIARLKDRAEKDDTTMAAAMRSALEQFLG
jgi:hypothetical protein